MTSNFRLLSKRKLMPLNHSSPQSLNLPYNIHFLTKNAVLGSLRFSDISPEMITQYLDNNHVFLENYLMNNMKYRSSYKSASLADSLIMDAHSDQTHSLNVTPETKVSLVTNRSDINLFSDDLTRKSSGAYRSVKERHIFIKQLTLGFDESFPRGSILRSLYECLKNSMEVDIINFYLIDSKNENLFLYDPIKMNNENEALGMYSLKQINSLITGAVFYNDCLMYPNLRLNNFPKLSKFTSDVNVIVAPISDANGSIYGVVELIRERQVTLFNKSDEELIVNYITWTSIAMFFTEILQKNSQQQMLNNVIMRVTQTMFANFKHMDNVIMDIMKYAKHIVRAQRSAFYVVEKETNEIVAQIFDVGGEHDVKFRTEKNNIRFPIGIGIAGHVAATGEGVNVQDAYKDIRFNRDIDLKTGYQTKSLLTIPVKLQTETVGVLQIVNKTDGSFTERDEEHLATFATYCGIALYISKMYGRIKQSEQRYKVALDVLSYHSGFDVSELSRLSSTNVITNWPEVSDFFFCPWDIDEIKQIEAFMFMFQTLFGIYRIGEHESTMKPIYQNNPWRFEKLTLMRFILTVKKNYRKVPYHNWSHAFTVGQSMFCILMNTSHKFTLIEALALLIACFCHDLDHRGKTNEYMVKSDVALGSLYSTSTMEHHHFSMTVSILQREDHNIFENMTSKDYKNVLSLIKYDILATDLNRFFKNNVQINGFINKNEIDWSNPNQRLLFMEITMTVSDLSAMHKPWDMQYDFVKVIMEEFWDQGDLEKTQGQVPARMMDRSFNYELPDLEIGFIQFICLPCYTTLNKILDGISEALEGLLKNLDKWKSLKDLPIEEKIKMFSTST